MRDFCLFDVLGIASLTHLGTLFFSSLMAVEITKHNCTGINYFSVFNIASAGIPMVVFGVWAIKEWRQERNDALRRPPQMAETEDLDDNTDLI